MSFEIEIVELIKKSQHELEQLKNDKKSAPTLSLEKKFLLDFLEKSMYVKGLQDALYIIQNKKSC